MPELPEVEHARRWLERWVVSARITAVVVEDARILDAGVLPEQISEALVGQRVKAVSRRGKWLRVALDRGCLFSHLGMTGKWQSTTLGDPLRFEKVRIDVLSRRTKRSVRYTDPRLFGRFLVVAEGGELPAFSALGPDPLADGIDLDTLAAKLARRALAIKPTLLDQTVLAGVGNILATEALFHARIDPRRPARDLSRHEVAALARGIRRSIQKTLEKQGDDPEIAYVEEPGASNPFIVYGREGSPCPRCKLPLGKMVLGGRGTVFCSACQV